MQPSPETVFSRGPFPCRSSFLPCSIGTHFSIAYFVLKAGPRGWFDILLVSKSELSRFLNADMTNCFQIIIILVTEYVKRIWKDDVIFQPCPNSTIACSLVRSPTMMLNYCIQIITISLCRKYVQVSSVFQPARELGHPQPLDWKGQKTMTTHCFPGPGFRSSNFHPFPPQNALPSSLFSRLKKVCFAARLTFPVW